MADSKRPATTNGSSPGSTGAKDASVSTSMPNKPAAFRPRLLAVYERTILSKPMVRQMLELEFWFGLAPQSCPQGQAEGLIQAVLLVRALQVIRPHRCGGKRFFLHEEHIVSQISPKHLATDHC